MRRAGQNPTDVEVEQLFFLGGTIFFEVELFFYPKFVTDFSMIQDASHLQLLKIVARINFTGQLSIVNFLLSKQELHKVTTIL